MNAAVAVSDSASFPVPMVQRARHGRETELVSLDDVSSREMAGEGIVGRSTALRSVLAELEMVAPTDSTVLICGETGTGKELIANAAHHLSHRRANAFVKCNCAAIPA